MTNMSRRGLMAAGALGAATLAAARAGDAQQTRQPTPASTRVAYVDSLKQPESALYDPDQDIWFISNINGPSLAKDGNGFITRLKGDGAVESRMWIQSGRSGVTLDAPKGMAIAGDTLWVSDIDKVRGFNRKTGAPVAEIDLAGQGASFLNDVCVGANGSVLITDTELEADARGNMSHPQPDRVFELAANRKVSVALQNDRLTRPNGIIWDQRNNRYVIVPYGGDTIVTWRGGTGSGGDSAAIQPLTSGPGSFDGVIVTNDGRLLVSSQATGSILALEGGKLVPVIEHLPGVADIGYDGKKNVVGVPLTGSNRVEFWKLSGDDGRTGKY